jgi:hypothetical protein
MKEEIKTTKKDEMCTLIAPRTKTDEGKVHKDIRNTVTKRINESIKYITERND